MTDNALVPLTEMERMATAIARSGLFGVKTPDQALALMLISHAEGRHPALAALDYDIVEGRPAKRSQAMLRDFLASGGKVEWHESSDMKADATFTHPAGGSLRIDWTTNRASKVTSWSNKKQTRVALIDKDVWKNYPRAMLRARVISEGVRAIYPAATGGLYEPGEIIDITEPERSHATSESAHRSGDAHGEPNARLTPEPASRAAVDAGIICQHEWQNTDDNLAVCKRCGLVLPGVDGDDNYSSAVNLLKSSADKGAFRSNWEAIKAQRDMFSAGDYQRLSQLMQSEAKRFMEPA